MSGLDGLILVASSQRDYWTRHLPKERLFIVPHGIDTDHFCPAVRNPDPSRPVICLTLGQWLRDFPTLAAAISRCNALPGLRREIQFRIVGPASESSRFTGLPNTVFRHGIADDELLRELQGADVMVMPLLDGTANTAVLEAMACGCAVLATDVGGVRDYLDGDCSRLVPLGNPEALSVAVRNLVSDHTLLLSAQRAARTRALQLSWPIVAEATRDAYRQIVELPHNSRRG
jgi:glycosyltransferase involved in cell wall biosynthesis